MTAQMLAEMSVEEIVAAMGQPMSGELFAGVGGLGMAVDEVFGTRPAWFCEFDEAPSKVLAHHFPDVPNFGDVTKVDWTAAPRVQVLAGGFPCQDVSLAGARRGMQDGTRSGLWSEYVKAIDALRPDWVVIENVRGLLSADGEPWHPDLIEADAEVKRIDQLIRMTDRFLHGNPARRREGRTPHVVEWRRAAVRLARSRKRAVRVRDRERGLVRRAIDTVLRDLADLGFDAEWCGLPASDVGAPHGRFRVFILAWPQERTPASDADRDGLQRVGRFDAFGRDADGCSRADEAGDGAESTSRDLVLLPTPTVVMNDGESTESWLARRERVKATRVNGNGMGMPLPIAVQLLPTPTASEGEHGGPGRTYGDGSPTLGGIASLLPTPSVSNAHGNDVNGRGEPILPGIAQLLPTPMVGSSSPAAHGQISGDFRAAMDRVIDQVKVLPTPTARLGDKHGRGASDPDRRKALNSKRAGELDEIAVHRVAADWGPYAGAIARWETVLGRPAPSPVRMDGKGGKARLNPELTEWMMGWPYGWVTASVIGLSRAEQLKVCGNGVVHRQAIAALRIMLARPGVPAVEWALAA